MFTLQWVNNYCKWTQSDFAAEGVIKKVLVPEVLELLIGDFASVLRLLLLPTY